MYNASWSPDETSAVIFAEKTWLQGMILMAVVYGVELTLFTMCMQLLIQRMTRDNRTRTIILLVYIFVMFICGTLIIASDAQMTQLSFITERNFPGGPSAFETDEFSIPIDELGNVLISVSQWLADGLLASRHVIHR